MNRFITVVAFIMVGTLSLVSCIINADDGECATSTNCVTSDDCDAGEHCNRALFPPKCQTLYCGSEGSPCSESALCAGQFCLNDVCENNMIKIPGGSFWMGCNEEFDDRCSSRALPYHKVTLSTYFIDKTEVTQSMYNECVLAGECDDPEYDWDPIVTPNVPVIYVNWHQAKTFCEWSGKRLPTEAEWEKAARGDDGRKFPWGNEEPTCDHAIFGDLVDGCGNSEPADVCSKSPMGDSPYGLCDMAGNVKEWTSDWYDADYYKISPAEDPKGPDSGWCRVVRGGVYYSSANDIRSTLRWEDYPPDESEQSLGFRCAKSVK